MARVWLHDDVPGPGVDRPTAVGAALTQGSCDDTELVEESQPHPSLTVSVRTRTGFDDDGNPEFEWAEIVTGMAIQWEERNEVDDVAGVTRVKAKAVILYNGDQIVTETCLVTSTSGGTFLVKKVAQIPGQSLEFDMERIEDSDAG